MHQRGLGRDSFLGPSSDAGWAENPLSALRQTRERIPEERVQEGTLAPVRSDTYVTRLVRAGVPVKTVQRLAGHSNLSTTLRYYDVVTEDDMRDAVAMLRKVQGAS